MYSVEAVIVLDDNGKSIVSRYYDVSDLDTKAKKKEFEVLLLLFLYFALYSLSFLSFFLGELVPQDQWFFQ